MHPTLAFLIILAWFLQPQACIGQVKKIDASSTVHFILSCQKANGAFGPPDKQYTDLAWTYPAIHALTLLKVAVPNKEAAFNNGNQPWIEKQPWKNGPWYWSFYQKANLFRLCNKGGQFEEDVHYGQSFSISYRPRTSYLELRNYPKGEFFDMSSLWHMVGAINLLDGKIENPQYARDYVLNRQAPKGGFVDDVAAEPNPTDERSHIIITHDAVMTLKTLGMPVPQTAESIEWIQSCQTPSGGFRWSPSAADHSNKPDVWYTWAAVAALQALGAQPADVDACIHWLNSLQNADGGFGDRPGWRSRLYSTYYAVHALDILEGDPSRSITEKEIRQSYNPLPEGVYKIFQAQHKTPDGGTGMVDSIAAMKFNLVGVKFREMDTGSKEGVNPSVIQARRYAMHRGYPLEILSAPENYSHKLLWINGQKADHVSNFLVPPDLSEKEVQIYEAAFKRGQQGLPWKQFKEEVIAPIQELRSGNLFYPELDYTVINAYMVYDDGLNGQPGYNAIPGAHFGNIDWIRHFPYKERWEGVLPVIADGDAHGNMIKWYPNLLQYRNVYIAAHYDFENYIDASLNQRSVCVMHMPDGEVRYYGAKEAIEYLKKHRKDWQWWEDRK